MTELSDDQIYTNNTLLRTVLYGANALSASGKFDESLIHYQRAVKIQPRNSEAWVSYGRILFDLARYEEALFAFDKAVEVHQKCLCSWMNRGITPINLVELEEALSSWKRVVILIPTITEKYTKEGDFHLSSERFEMAINCYDIAIKSIFSYCNSCYYISVFVGALGLEEEEIYFNDESSKFQDNEDIIFLASGDSLQALERYEEAIHSYRQTIKINPSRHEIWADIVYLLIELGRYEESLVACINAIEHNLDDACLWHCQGYSFFKLNRYTEALLSYEKSIQINPKDDLAWNNYGEVLYSSGQEDKAITAWKKALEINSDCFKAKDSLNNALHKLESVSQQIRLVSQNNVNVNFNFNSLDEFYQEKQRILDLCREVSTFIQGVANYLPSYKNLENDINKVNVSVSEQRFRIAVVGEFSRGKSTLLNALVGEEIQPVKSLPCSGSISIIRYGDVKRVTCCYKDGSSKEIPLDLYKKLVSLSQAASEGDISDELADSEIDEVIYEHPGLDFCRHGIEIVDSPGLNEHPDRTRVTYQLLENTDAIIFITSAMNHLSQTERDLLNEFKMKLSVPIESTTTNLFVVVNFMDQIDCDEWEDLARRSKRILSDNNIIPEGLERLYFISARQALRDKLSNKKSEYREKFDDFRSSLEKYLMTESGEQIVQRSRRYLQSVIQEVEVSLRSSQNSLNSKENFSRIEKERILALIGDVAGMIYKSREAVSYYKGNVLETIRCQWGSDYSKVERKVRERSNTWTTTKNDSKSIRQDFSSQLSECLLEEFKALTVLISDQRSQPFLDMLGDSLQENLVHIKKYLQSIDVELNSTLLTRYSLFIDRLPEQLAFNCSDGGENYSAEISILDSLKTGFLKVFKATAALFSDFSITAQVFKVKVENRLQRDHVSQAEANFKKELEIIRKIVLNEGLKNFNESSDKLCSQVNTSVSQSFDKINCESENIYQNAITLLSSLLQVRANDIKKSERSRLLEISSLENKINSLKKIQDTLLH